MIIAYPMPMHVMTPIMPSQLQIEDTDDTNYEMHCIAVENQEYKRLQHLESRWTRRLFALSILEAFHVLLILLFIQCNRAPNCHVLSIPVEVRYQP